MRITFEWGSCCGDVPRTRTFRQLSQREVNDLISDVSKNQDKIGEVPVKITVSEDTRDS